MSTNEGISVFSNVQDKVQIFIIWMSMKLCWSFKMR